MKNVVLVPIGQTDGILWFGRVDRNDGTVLLFPRGEGYGDQSVLRVLIEDISDEEGRGHE